MIILYIPKSWVGTAILVETWRFLQTVRWSKPEPIVLKPKITFLGTSGQNAAESESQVSPGKNNYNSKPKYTTTITLGMTIVSKMTLTY